MNKEEIYAEEAMDVDPGMDTKMIDDADNEKEVQFDLFHGISMHSAYKDSDWDSIAVEIPNFEDTILQLKRVYNKALRCEEGDERDEFTASIIDELKELHTNLGLSDMGYENIREGITDYEIVLTMCTNLCVVLSTMVSVARETKLIKDLEILTSGVNTLFTGMDGTSEISEDMVAEFISNLNEIAEEFDGTNNTDAADVGVPNETDETDDEQEDDTNAAD